MENKNEILTVAQVAEKLMFSVVHIRELLKSGEIPGFKRGKRSWGIFATDLDAWIKSRSNSIERARRGAKILKKEGIGS